MKKLIALSAASLVALAGASFADPVEVPGVGTVTANEGGYVVYAEGNDDNDLGPLSGFAFVDEDGRACADDNGHAPDDDNTNDPDSSSITCTP